MAPGRPGRILQPLCSPLRWATVIPWLKSMWSRVCTKTSIAIRLCNQLEMCMLIRLLRFTNILLFLTVYNLINCQLIVLFSPCDWCLWVGLGSIRWQRKQEWAQHPMVVWKEMFLWTNPSRHGWIPQWDIAEYQLNTYCNGIISGGTSCVRFVFTSHD